MSSWLNDRSITKVKTPIILKVEHTGGFFSCCSVQLGKIIKFYNKYKSVPQVINTDEQFGWYRPGTTETYFTTQNTQLSLPKKYVDYEHFYQYTDYTKLDYAGLAPFVKKYFSPSEEIQEIMRGLEAKYLLDYDNICVLFYRGNDKVTETPVPTYEDYVKRAAALLEREPKLRFLVQSDETEFIEAMESAFPGKTVVFRDEIRHISKSLTTVDMVFKDDNFKFSKFYVAITIIMSKCRHIIFGSGNCSIWIALFRGNSRNVQQFLKTGWIGADAP